MQISEELEKQIDELGEIQRRLDLVKPLEIRARELRLRIVDSVKHLNADDQVELVGKFYVAQVGKASLKHTVKNMSRLLKRLGQKVFLEHCTIPLGVVEQLVSDPSEFLSEERSGPRPVRTVPRVAAGGKAAA